MVGDTQRFFDLKYKMLTKTSLFAYIAGLKMINPVYFSLEEVFLNVTFWSVLADMFDLTVATECIFHSAIPIFKSIFVFPT